MIRFLIPTAKEMKASKEVPSQKLSEKSAAILTEMAKLSTDELSIAYKIKPEQAEKRKAALGVRFCREKRRTIRPSSFLMV